MNPVDEKIANYKKKIDFFTDTMAKYKFIIERAKKAKPLSDEYKTDLFKVEGCLSQVWVVPKYEDGIMHYMGDSDSHLVRGTLTMILDIYGGKTPKEIIESEKDLTTELDLGKILTPQRSNGAYNMIKKIKDYAEKLA